MNNSWAIIIMAFFFMIGVILVLIYFSIKGVKFLLKKIKKKENGRVVEVNKIEDFPSTDNDIKLSEKSILDSIKSAINFVEKEHEVETNEIIIDREEKQNELEEITTKLVILRNYGNKLKELFEKYKTREAQLIVMINQMNEIIGEKKVKKNAKIK